MSAKENAMFRNAIVRPPGPDFLRGITTSRLGPPIYEKALGQHRGYCEALERCGLQLTRLEPDPRHPDGTFVEDAAVVTPGVAVLTHPGSETRRGEVASVEKALARFYPKLERIVPPGVLDGGDVCDAGDRFFVGISERTNEQGARQLAAFLEGEGRRCTLVDIRGTPAILHLKSGLASLGEGRLAVIEALAEREDFRGFEIIRIAPGEEYAANCVRVNDAVLVAAGFPQTEERLRRLGCSVVPLEVSEFQKMDGGLSCISLRF